MIDRVRFIRRLRIPTNVSQSAKRSNHTHTQCSPSPSILPFFPSFSFSLDQDFRFAACLLVHVEKVLVNTLEIELKPAGEIGSPLRALFCNRNKTIMECRTITQLISFDLWMLDCVARRRNVETVF